MASNEEWFSPHSGRHTALPWGPTEHVQTDRKQVCAVSTPVVRSVSMKEVGWGDAASTVRSEQAHLTALCLCDGERVRHGRSNPPTPLQRAGGEQIVQKKAHSHFPFISLRLSLSCPLLA